MYVKPWIPGVCKAPNFVATNRDMGARHPRPLSTKSKLGSTHTVLSL